jgi:hypothetical protein
MKKRIKTLADGSTLHLLRQFPNGTFRVLHRWATGYQVLILNRWD